MLFSMAGTAAAQTRAVTGQAGLLAEWDLTATVTEKGQWTGPLSLKHVGFRSVRFASSAQKSPPSKWSNGFRVFNGMRGAAAFGSNGITPFRLLLCSIQRIFDIAEPWREVTGVSPFTWRTAPEIPYAYDPPRSGFQILLLQS
jgi:hypothetical protein